MKCPVCNGETKVTCSRATDNSVIRWRKCVDCKQSIYTEELETTHNAFKNAVPSVRVRNHKKPCVVFIFQSRNCLARTDYILIML